MLRWAIRNQDREISFAPLFFAAAALLLLLFAWVRPIDHDETQYVAAVALTPRLLPYRDFAYLQTPLHPLLFGPFAQLFPGHLWEALRAANALIGAAMLWFVYRAQREIGVPQITALIAAALLAACDGFLFGAATARNDILPALFESIGIWLLVRSYTRSADPKSSFLIGLLMAAAAAAKISYALPLAAMLPILVVDQIWGGRRLHCPWLAAGVLLAVSPVALLALLYPDGFAFGVLRFPATAPSLWYEATGQGWKLGLAAKALDTAKFLALGPALVAIWVLTRRLLSGDSKAWRTNLVPIYLDVLLVAGSVAAILPTPTWRQYLVPLLPPLFIRLGMTIDQKPLARRTTIALLVTALAGLGPSLLALASAAWSWESPLAQATLEAHQIGDAVRAAGAEGTVAGLSPTYWVDSGLPIDPRFAAGPFLFRMTGLLSPREKQALHVVNLDNYQAELRRQPPDLLITGAEPARINGTATLDGALDNFAIRNGYRRIDAPDTRLIVYARRRSCPTGPASRLPRLGCAPKPPS
jgi:4-amino-4-deoxy-L-arabinose transferase-like glycosyltransferase